MSTTHTENDSPKIAIITGGNRGLGRADALALAATGVDSIITYRSDAEAAASVVAEITQSGRKAVALQLDTTVVASFDAFTERVRDALRQTWSRETFDILINNAGSGANAPFAETTEAQFDEMVGVHLKGVFFLTQRLLPLLTDGGSIVNYSTGLTRFTNAGYAAYAMVKGAIEVLTKYQAAELGARGIRVNTVAPGPIATEFGGGVLQNPDFQAAIAERTALGRIGQAQDVGDAIASLVADANRWITAQRIEISGGTLL